MCMYLGIYNAHNAPLAISRTSMPIPYMIMNGERGKLSWNKRARKGTKYKHSHTRHIHIHTENFSVELLFYMERQFFIIYCPPTRALGMDWGPSGLVSWEFLLVGSDFGRVARFQPSSVQVCDWIDPGSPRCVTEH